MPRKIFLVYACDVWKSRGSFVLEGATTSLHKVKQFVKKEILYGCNADMQDPSKVFKIKNYATVEDINNDVRYIFVEEVGFDSLDRIYYL